MTLAVLTREFDALPVEAQLDYVQLLWERVAQRPDGVPVPDWHLALVGERLAAHLDGSDETVDWGTLKTQLLDE